MFSRETQGVRSGYRNIGSTKSNYFQIEQSRCLGCGLFSLYPLFEAKDTKARSFCETSKAMARAIGL